VAKVSFKLPDELALQLSKLGERTDEIVPKVLEAGGEVVLAKVRSNLQSALSGQSTGELVAALGVSPAKLNRNGDFDVKIGFDEPRSDGSSNAMVANTLEYGKHGQPARPFMKPAKSQSQKAAIAAMEAKFEEEVSKL
jgi:HK97 gp10 family phage protein